MFSGSKHTIAPERILLGATMVEMTECLKSWVKITPGRQQAPLSGVFRESRFIDEAAEYLEMTLGAEGSLGRLQVTSRIAG